MTREREVKQELEKALTGQGNPSVTVISGMTHGEANIRNTDLPTKLMELVPSRLMTPLFLLAFIPACINLINMTSGLTIAAGIIVIFNTFKNFNLFDRMGEKLGINSKKRAKRRRARIALILKEALNNDSVNFHIKTPKNELPRTFQTLSGLSRSMDDINEYHIIGKINVDVMKDYTNTFRNAHVLTCYNHNAESDTFNVHTITYRGGILSTQTDIFYGKKAQFQKLLNTVSASYKSLAE